MTMTQIIFELTEIEAAYAAAALAIAIQDDTALLSAFDKRIMRDICDRLGAPLSLRVGKIRRFRSIHGGKP